MLSWVKILLFGGSTLISPSPMIIGENFVSIIFDKKITAYNRFAKFHVNVSEYANGPRSNGPLHFVKNIEENFPIGCISINLISDAGDSITFKNIGVGWNSPQDVWVIVTADQNLPAKEYFSMTISSCKKLNKSSLTWFNYGKH